MKPSHRAAGTGVSACPASSASRPVRHAAHASGPPPARRTSAYRSATRRLQSASESDPSVIVVQGLIGVVMFVVVRMVTEVLVMMLAAMRRGIHMHHHRAEMRDVVP